MVGGGVFALDVAVLQGELQTRRAVVQVAIDGVGHHALAQQEFLEGLDLVRVRSSMKRLPCAPGRRRRCSGICQRWLFSVRLISRMTSFATTLKAGLWGSWLEQRTQGRCAIALWRAGQSRPQVFQNPGVPLLFFGGVGPEDPALHVNLEELADGVLVQVGNAFSWPLLAEFSKAAWHFAILASRVPQGDVKRFLVEVLLVGLGQ